MKNVILAKLVSRIFVSLIFICSLSLHADDTDVYINSSDAAGGEPLIMFSIDWRNNLGATVCTATIEVAGETVNECEHLLGDYLGNQGGDHTFLDLLRAAMKQVLDPLTGIRVGLMFNHENGVGSSCAGLSAEGCTNGGFIMSRFVSLSDPVAKAALFAQLDAIPPAQGDQAHKYQGKELYFEFFRYLTGQGIYNGHNGWSDFASNELYNINDVLDTVANNGTTATPTWDVLAEDNSNSTYGNPLTGVDSCSKIFAVNIMFQVSQQEDDSDAAIRAETSAGGMGLSLSGNTNSFDTVIEFLNDVDLADGTLGTSTDISGTQNVTSYFMVDSSHDNITTNGYASAGGTGRAYVLSEDPTELIQSFANIFNQILSVSTTFVAPSVPVNVFNRAQTLQEVFIALFEANDDGLPQWVGNLKKLKIGETSAGDSELQDANGDSAIANDGRIQHSALTYWTNPDDLPALSDEEIANGIPVSGKDGRTVTRGGAGSRIPGFAPSFGNTPGTTNPAGNTTSTTTRKLFTEPSSFANGTPTSLVAFNADATTAVEILTNDDDLFGEMAPCTSCSYATASDALKATATSNMITLMKFGRGLDVTDEDEDGEIDDVRPWIFGDSLHARPIPINYGARTGYTEANPDIRVVMGSNDGFVRMFRAGDSDGVEAWGFMPRDAIVDLIRLKENAARTPVHPYSVDGAASALVIDNNNDGTITSSGAAPTGGDRVYLFFGQRRGGKNYNALDISDPDNPKILWTIEKGTAGSDFAELGQSWSTPRVAQTYVDTGSGAVLTPALFIGGGFNGDDDGDDSGDQGKDDRDADPLVGTNDDEGNAIFIINALTGDLIWKAIKGTATGADSVDSKVYNHTDLFDSVPASISTVDSDGDGSVDRFYVGDTAGVVWRGDITGGDTTAWKLTKVFSVGRHYSNTNVDDRRFYHRADFVRTKDLTGDYDAIIISSGDRPHPLGTAVDNYIYMFKDRNTISGIPPSTVVTHSQVADLTSNCLQDAADGTNCDADELLEVAKMNIGWKIKLEGCEAGQTGQCGEKGLARPVTLLGTVFLTTYIPPSASEDTCAPPEGNGLFYAISLEDGTAIFNFNTANDDGGETKERSETLSSSGIPAELVPLGSGQLLRGDLQIQHVPGGAGARTYWYEKLLL